MSPTGILSVPCPQGRGAVHGDDGGERRVRGQGRGGLGLRRAEGGLCDLRGRGARRAEAGGELHGEEEEEGSARRDDHVFSGMLRALRASEVRTTAVARRRHVRPPPQRFCAFPSFKVETFGL